MKTRPVISGTLKAFLSVLAVTAAMFQMSSCGGTDKKADEIDSTMGLKDFYKDYFVIGVSVSPGNLQGDEAELIKKHFNSITATNVMKPGPIHPEENTYYWDDADKVVEFAEANGMKVRGHTLCWHNQTGEWMFVDEEGNPASKELALRRLEDHIKTVVSHYKGRIYAWDVLNEVITDDDNAISPYRQTKWLELIGEEYIARIFQWAHEADPDAVLVYNDYNTENPGKRDRIYTMVKGLLDAGVPVHAIGMQRHDEIGNPSEEKLRATIDKFSSLGVELQVTELDVSIYAGRNDTIDIGFTAAREQKQIDLYKMEFDVFRDNKDKITGVTFWNVSDRRSWRDSREPQGKVYPLLFDENLQPKKVFWEIVKF